MNRQTLRKLLALLCGLMLIGATLLTGCAANPSQGDGEQESAIPLYRPSKAEDGTYNFQIVKGEEVLFSKGGFDRACIKENHGEDVFSVTWITGKNPTDYETVYCNKKTGAISEVFAGVLATDGVRVVFSQIDDYGCAIIVRDIFDESVFYFTQLLADAYTGGECTIMGGIATDETHVTVSYISDDKGGQRLARVNMYPETAE